jgi:hypothetical protein
MPLASRKLVQYLLDIGAVDVEAVVGGDLMVVDCTRRHRNHKILRRGGAGCFVKQARPDQPLSDQSLHREAVCGWLVREDERFAALRPLLPQWRAYDATRRLLVTELLPESENLAERHARLGGFPAETATMLGQALGRAHAGVSLPPAGAPGTEVFPRALPWVLTMHTLADSQFERMSGGHAQILGLVRRHAEFPAALESLRQGWRHDGLIHGDMKFENCLVLTGGEPQLRIVDWELADFGDTLWDVGGVLQAYLNTWVLSMPEFDEADAERLMRHAQHPLEALQPAMQAFWQAYVALRPEAELDPCVQYAAARMIQTVYEHMAQASQLTRGGLRMLQLSMNMLTRPNDAIRDLLGWEAA